jgi:hypothetical protein
MTPGKESLTGRHPAKALATGWPRQASDRIRLRFVRSEPFLLQAEPSPVTSSQLDLPSEALGSRFLINFRAVSPPLDDPFAAE